MEAARLAPAAAREQLARDLAPIALLDDRRFALAAAGCPQAAIGLALDRIRRGPVVDIRSHLILAALWRCAADGDAAAAAALAVVKRRVPRTLS
ncbi:hypothetical protein [Methylopila turkensis]|nr:hypothetical protein [Methylopila turkensis]